MKLLQQLVSTPGVPGREQRVRDLIASKVKNLVDDLTTDAMGNLIGYRKPRPAKGRKTTNTKGAKPLRVMLAAHMDQIGFIVKHVDDKGYIRVHPAGGFDPRNLFARRVLVCTAQGDLPGVMNPGGRPLHISTDDDRKKIPEVHEFYIDLGIDKEKVTKKVKIGDMVVLDAPFLETDNAVVCQCLDDRVGCWALIRMLEQLKHHDCEIYPVWTVQEEVGLRGAGPAAFGVEPDVALSCDTTICADVPGVDAAERVTEFGGGVALKIMDSSTIADIALLDDIERVAKKAGIKTQRALLPRGGQDGAMMQRSRAGVRTAVFACPTRFIHTVTEMCAKEDIQGYPKLLAAWLAQA
jgi:putative aminopeptidase FrvX